MIILFSDWKIEAEQSGMTILSITHRCSFLSADFGRKKLLMFWARQINYLLVDLLIPGLFCFVYWCYNHCLEEEQRVLCAELI